MTAEKHASRWVIKDKDGNVVAFVWLTKSGACIRKLVPDAEGKSHWHRSDLPWDKFMDAIEGQLNFLPA